MNGSGLSLPVLLDGVEGVIGTKIDFYNHINIIYIIIYIILNVFNWWKCGNLPVLLE